MLTIEEIQKEVIPVAKNYNIPTVYLFGSYARGNATTESDIDLAVKLQGSSIETLLDLSSFKVDLEEALNCNVDVSEIKEMEKLKGIQTIFAEDFKQERILLYDKTKISERYILH